MGMREGEGGMGRTLPELPWTMFWPSMGPLSLEPSPLRGMVCLWFWGREEVIGWLDGL
jgi:hypothetical protein